MRKEWEIWDDKEVDNLERVWGLPTEGKRTRHQDLVETVSKLISGKSILDVGCGMGHLYGLIKDNVETYLGVDSSPAMIRKARYYFSDELFALGDAYDLSTFPSADTVVCLDLVKHIPETWPVLKQLWRKSRRQLILVTNVGPKQYTRKTPRSKGKYLIYRVETIDNLMALFKKLPNVGRVDQIHFNSTKGTVIFRVHKNV